LPGRFTQQDSIEHLTDPAQGNSYAYAADNPINYIDPAGTDAVCSGTFFVAGITADTVLYYAVELGFITGGWGFLAGVAIAGLYFVIEQAVCNSN